MKNKKTYPSDISREQFERIRETLESARKKTKPRTVDLHDVFNAVLHILKSGCQWDMLPSDYPNPKTVHWYFRIWKEEGEEGESALDRCLKKMAGEARVKQGRKPSTSFLIVDAQSVKNTDTAKEKGYDGGKKVSGIKRHIAVDTNGLPHAIHVTTADVTDRKGAIEMLGLKAESLSQVESLLVDGGYSGEAFARAVKESVGASVQVAKRNELHAFKVIPKRWVVERSFAWLEKCRRLWKNCEKTLRTSLAMVQLAFIRLLLKRS